MAMLGVLTQSKKIIGPAQVYLVPYPTGGYVGTTDALREVNVKSLFFSDSATDACRVLIPNPWADLDATGVEIKLTPDEVEYDSNLVGKVTVGYGPTAGELSFSFKDIDQNHIIDMFSALTGDIYTTAPGASIAGRTTVLVGRQSTPALVAAMVRFPSAFISPSGVQEYDFIIVPMCTLNPKLELKVNHKNATVAKLNPKAIADYSLIGSQPYPPIALIAQVTAVATS